MSATITLTLSDVLLERAKREADSRGEPLEQVLTETIAAGLPSIQNVPLELHDEFQRMIWLTDADLELIIASSMSDDQQAELERLAEIQAERELNPSEKAALENLRLEYGRATLRKARAYALLSLRAGKPVLANE